MSLFLGPIHHWLYNKIRLFSDLEENIIEAVNSSREKKIDNYVHLINEKFGYPLEDKPLEELIDSSNIHGWLHGRIGEAESRQAALITYIIREYEQGMDIIKGVYSAQAERCALSIDKSSITSPEVINKLINDFILDGMPCDNVKSITISTDELLQWKVSNCLHKDYWDKVDGDINVFYDLRSLWISTFIDTLNCGYFFEFHKETVDNSTVLVSEIKKVH